MRGSVFSKVDLKKMLPYGEPFLFLDKVTSLSKTNIVAEKKINKDYSFFKGHFKGFPLMPGLLTLEAIGQTGTLLVRHILGKRRSEVKDVLLQKIHSADFKRPLFPDDLIEMEVNLVKREGHSFVCKGEVRFEEHCMAKVKFTLVVVDKKEFRKK